MESTLLRCILQVYDGTAFLKDHPGGADSILLVAGTDATEEFNAIHSEKAKKQLLQYVIGRLAPSAHPGLLPSYHSLTPVGRYKECWYLTCCSEEAAEQLPLGARLARQGWRNSCSG